MTSHGIKLQRKAGVAVITESLSFEDGQPVQLEDGSVAYIHRTPKGGVRVITNGGEGRDSELKGAGEMSGSWSIAIGIVAPKAQTHSPVTA
jgi:hypothetical protein